MLSWLQTSRLSAFVFTLPVSPTEQGLKAVGSCPFCTRAGCEVQRAQSSVIFSVLRCWPASCTQARG